MPAAAAMTASAVEDVVVLRDIAWETYRQLNDENFSPAIRMAFFEGSLEIMTVSADHENWARAIETLVQTLAWAVRLDVKSFGSVTMRRKDLRAGLEPDACFYFGQMAAAMRGRKVLNLHSDPAPDLAVEIDISRRSFAKFPIYAALGIREIWRFHEGELALYELAEGEYRAIERSMVLPRMTGARLTQLLADSQTMASPEWLDRVRSAMLAEG